MTRALVFLLLLIGAIHIAGILNSWYFTYPWIDIPMHFLGGMWAVFFLFWIFEKKKNDYLFTSPKVLSFLFALGFAALVGILWEFFEFLFDVFISSRGFAYAAQTSSADTMGDLFMDLVGGFFAWSALLNSEKSDYISDDNE